MQPEWKCYDFGGAEDWTGGTMGGEDTEEGGLWIITASRKSRLLGFKWAGCK